MYGQDSLEERSNPHLRHKVVIFLSQLELKNFLSDNKHLEFISENIRQVTLVSKKAHVRLNERYRQP